MISRRSTLLATLPFVLTARIARAEDENQQIALDNPGEYIQAASIEEARGRHDIETPKFIGPIMRYPFLTTDGVREGWVLLEMDVLKDGSVRNAAVAESYPTGLFDKPTLKHAEGMRFTPAQIDGQPRETMRHRFRVVFVQGDAIRGASEENFNRFKRAIRALNEKKLDKVAPEIEELRKSRDAGKFNLTELARFSDLSARFAFAKQNRIEANELISTTLWLGRYLDSEEALKSAYTLRLILHAFLGKYDQAVDYFDAYNRVYGDPAPSIVMVVDELRGKGFGKGVKYEIERLADLRKNNRVSKDRDV